MKFSRPIANAVTTDITIEANHVESIAHQNGIANAFSLSLRNWWSLEQETWIAQLRNSLSGTDHANQPSVLFCSWRMIHTQLPDTGPV